MLNTGGLIFYNSSNTGVISDNQILYTHKWPCKERIIIDNIEQLVIYSLWYHVVCFEKVVEQLGHGLVGWSVGSVVRNVAGSSLGFYPLLFIITINLSRTVSFRSLILRLAFRTGQKVNSLADTRNSVRTLRHYAQTKQLWVQSYLIFSTIKLKKKNHDEWKDIL